MSRLHWVHRDYGHRDFGHRDFGHRRFDHLRRPWRPWEGSSQPNGDDGGPPPPPQPNLPFPFPPLPLPPFLEIGEQQAEARPHGSRQYRRWRRQNDQEVGLDDRPSEARGEERRRLRHRGRWLRRHGTVTLLGI